MENLSEKYPKVGAIIEKKNLTRKISKKFRKPNLNNDVNYFFVYLGRTLNQTDLYGRRLTDYWRKHKKK